MDGALASLRKQRPKSYGWATRHCHHKAKAVAKVAAARKLAVRLYWMLRQNVAYPEIARIESSSRVALAGNRHPDDLIERSRTPQ